MSHMPVKINWFVDTACAEVGSLHSKSRIVFVTRKHNFDFNASCHSHWFLGMTYRTFRAGYLALLFPNIEFKAKGELTIAWNALFAKVIALEHGRKCIGN